MMELNTILKIMIAVCACVYNIYGGSNFLIKLWSLDALCSLSNNTLCKNEPILFLLLLLPGQTGLISLWLHPLGRQH